MADVEHHAQLQELFRRLTKEQQMLIDTLIYCWGKDARLPSNDAIGDQAASTVKTHINDICKIVDPYHRWPNKKIKRLLLVRFFWPLRARHPKHPPPDVVVPDPAMLVLPSVDVSETADAAISNTLDCQIDGMRQVLTDNTAGVPKERALVALPPPPPPLLVQRALPALLAFQHGVSWCQKWLAHQRHGRIFIEWPSGRRPRYAPSWQRNLMRAGVLILAVIILSSLLRGELKVAAAPHSSPLVIRATRILVGLGNVMTVTWAHQHPWLAEASTDGMVALWDGAHNWSLRPLQPAFKAHATALCWSPDDRYLAGGDFAGHIAIWDTTTGLIVRWLSGHTDQIQWLAWSPDGTMLASASWDATVRVWNPTTGALLQVLSDHRDYATAVAWSPDSHWLATGGNDDAIFVYHVSTWNKPRQFIGSAGPIRSLIWSEDGQDLLSTSVDETARVWDVASGHNTIRLVHDSVLKDGIWGPGAYHPYIATVTEDGHLYLWDIRHALAVMTTPMLAQNAAQIERQQGVSGMTADSLGSVQWSGDWIATGSLDLSVIILWQISPAP